MRLILIILIALASIFAVLPSKVEHKNVIPPIRDTTYLPSLPVKDFSALDFYSPAYFAGFPTTDSLHRYTNRFITNSAINAFTDFRINTLLHGIIDWIDSARLGTGGSVGVDTVWAINDSTIRYIKNGVNHTFNVRGGAVHHNITLTGKGISTDPLKVDTTVLKTKADAQRVTDSLVALLNVRVDSIYRKTATDSIYYRKGGIEYAIKDSSGSSGTTLTNAAAPGDTILISNTAKRLIAGYGVTHTVNATSITSTVDTGSTGLATQDDLRGDTSRTSSAFTITLSNGRTIVLKLVDVGSAKAGLMSPTDKGRLDSIYNGDIQDSIIVSNAGAGERIGYASNDTLFLKPINCTGCTIATNPDSSLQLTITGGGTINGNGNNQKVAVWKDADELTFDNTFGFDTTTNLLTGDSSLMIKTRADTLRANLRLGIGGSPTLGFDMRLWNGANAQFVNTTGSSGQLNFISTQSSWPAGFIGITNAQLYYGVNNAFPITFFTSNLERLRVSATGNFGIGNVAPSFKLDVWEVGTGLTSNNNFVGRLRNTSTINTTASDKDIYGLDISNAATESAGSNLLNNYGARISAKNGDAQVALKLIDSTAQTTTTATSLLLSHVTSGTAAAGFGNKIDFSQQNGSGTQVIAAAIETPYITVTNGSEVADIVFKPISTTLAERLRIRGNGLITFGGTSSSFPALKQSSANLQVRLADDSGFGDLEVADEAYDATTWNGSNEVPTKNAVRDKIESLPTISIDTGSWVPTGTNITNYNGSLLVLKATYIRTGNQVVCDLALGIDCISATTETELEITFPIASTLNSNYDCIGDMTSFANSAASRKTGYVVGNTSTNKAKLRFECDSNPALANNLFFIRFKYQVN